MPDIKSIKCASCGGNVQLDLDDLISYCPYCGTALMVDMSFLNEVLLEKERTKQMANGNQTAVLMLKYMLLFAGGTAVFGFIILLIWGLLTL